MYNSNTETVRTQAFAPLTQEIDAWLKANKLPSMSLDDLWFELIAVRDGAPSAYVVDVSCAAAAELCVECKALWDRWDAIEAQFNVR